VAGCCEYGDEPSGSGATVLVIHHPICALYTSSGGLCLITSQLPVSRNTSERHSQTNGYAAVWVSMPPGPLIALRGCTWLMVRASQLDLPQVPVASRSEALIA
jgi:hypothetical protein